MKRWPRIIAWGLLLLLSLFCGFLLYYGVSSPLTTFCLYFWTGWAIWKLIQGFFSGEKRKKAVLILLSSLSLLFFSEMALRFVFRQNLSYQEANGSLFYYSPYHSPAFEAMMRRQFLGEEDVGLRIHPPNSEKWYDKPEFRYLHTYNAEGLRGPNWSEQKAPQTFRVATFGDSFTEGIGAPQDSTWPALLQGILQQRDSFQNVEVLNLGCSGSDIVFEAYKWEQIGRKYRPDAVILAINRSDLDDLLLKGGRGEGPMGRDYREAPFGERLYAASYLYRSVFHSLGDRNSLLLSPEQMDAGYRDARKLLMEYLKVWTDHSEKEGFRLWVLLHPTLQEWESGRSDLDFVGEGAAALPGVEVIDLWSHWQYEGMTEKQSYRELYWPVDRHHNGQGYWKMAESIGEVLGKENSGLSQ